jgi:uncharacterized membrane protein
MHHVAGAVLFGIVAGLRTFTGEAVFFGFAGTGWARIVFPIAAVGEYAVDALPGMFARTQIPSVLLRALSGAFMGHVSAGVPGIAAGVIFAVLATYQGYAIRMKLIEALGALPAAIAEDALAIALAAAGLFILPR